MSKVKNKSTPLPEVGDEVRIVIGPAPLFGPMWTQVGEVIAAWKTRKGRRRMVIKVTRSLREDENVDGFITEDIWNSCIFVAGPESEYLGATEKQCDRNDWVAMYAASAKTLELVEAECHSKQ